MDILTHTLSGVAIGTVVASFSKKRYRQKLGLILIAAFGAALPDFDAISLWSKFDAVFGEMFGLTYSGKEIYFSKLWYSHHAFMHSLFAGILISMCFVLIYYLIQSRGKSFSIGLFIQYCRNVSLLLLSFILGFTIHLLQDMPTPASVWGGVNLFWPSENYIGGTGDIWWWNNYDIFLIVLAIILLNGLAHLLSRFYSFDTRKITVVVIIIGFSLSLFQIRTREFNFEYTGHTPRYSEYELKSKEMQKQILGERLYEVMHDFDNKLGFNF